MIRIKINSLIIIFIIIFINTSTADEIFLKEKSLIDWERGHIVSKGKARIIFNDAGKPVDNVTGKAKSLNKAREAAYLSAMEAAIINMAEAVQSLRIDPNNRFIDIMMNDTSVQKSISDKLNNFIMCKEYPSGFDSAICEAKLDFGTIIASLPYDFPSNDFPARAEIPISTPYSGLIIDCRGLEVKPMLFPAIYSDTGLEIYGRNYIDSSFAVKGGMASYCYTENQALTDRRAGEHPYLSVAMKSLNSCPVLLGKDVRRIFSSQITINNLKKCRVILIIDK
ncbi:MAG: hypothetical protein JXN64_14760 [Spirochaetes bacterium]|nr:hypothetical protein [Spirochaetota bacterium]